MDLYYWVICLQTGFWNILHIVLRVVFHIAITRKTTCTIIPYLFLKNLLLLLKCKWIILTEISNLALWQYIVRLILLCKREWINCFIVMLLLKKKKRFWDFDINRCADEWNCKNYIGGLFVIVIHMTVYFYITVIIKWGKWH